VDAPEGAETYRIERLEVMPQGESRRLVAVLDDDADVTDSLCSQLQLSHYDFSRRPSHGLSWLLHSARSATRSLLCIGEPSSSTVGTSEKSKVRCVTAVVIR